MLRTAALLEHQLNEALRPFGITELQYNVLRILRGAGPDGLCGREIAERLVSKVPDVSRLLDRMEEHAAPPPRAGRHRSPARHGPHHAQGPARAGGGHRPALEAFERERFGHFDAERLQQIIDGLADVRDAL